MVRLLQDAIYEIHDSRRTACVVLRLLEQQARKHGVTLHLHRSFERLRECREGAPLMPCYDPDCYAGGHGFWLQGTNHVGETVTTQAARLYHSVEASLAELWENLELLYRPVERASPGENCVCHIDSAMTMRGRLLFGGATWVRKDHRGRRLGGLLPRISRTLGHLLWDQDYSFAVVEDDIAASSVVPSIGYPMIEAGITWTGSKSYGDQWLNLMWMDQSQLLVDIEAKLGLTVAA